MTAEEKTTVSKLLNLAEAYTGSGYSRERTFAFEDDQYTVTDTEVAATEQNTAQTTILPLAYLIDEDEEESTLVLILGAALDPQEAGLLSKMLTSAGLFMDRNCLMIDNEAEIRLYNPKIVLCLGKNRAKTIQVPEEIPVIATYYPRELLADESLKRPAFEDMKQLMALLAGLDSDYARESKQLLAKYAAADADFAAKLKEHIK